MLQKTLAKDLKVGMFVADLDRPWMDTPFMLQGFVLENQEQVAQVQAQCQWVLVDPARSSGPEFEAYAKPRPQPIPRRDLGTDPIVVITRTQTPRANGGDPSADKDARQSTATTSRAPNNGKANGSGTDADSKKTSRSREFAINVRTTTADEDLSATGRFRVEGLLPPRENIRPAPTSFSSLWGQLKQDVKGLFTRSQEESFDDSSYEAPAKAIENIRPSFVPETVQLTIYEDEQTVEGEIDAASQAFHRTQDLLHRVIDDIRSGNQLQIEMVNNVMEDMVDSMVRNPDAMMWVARLREQDTMTYDHGLSVAINLVAFGRHLGFPREQLSNLGVMGLMLDIGKMRVPRELLEKKEHLNADEFVTMKLHVKHGMDILYATPNIHPDVLEGVAQHHERMDGTGYPIGLSGGKISIYGRMSGVADTYAAITKRRPYADPVSPHEALQMLSNWSVNLFQPDMVEQFIQSIGVFPVGSLVELSTGEVAVIVTHNKQKRLKPKVLIVTEADKKILKHPTVRDLLYDVSEMPTYIKRGLPANAFGIDPSEFYLN